MNKSLLVIIGGSLALIILIFGMSLNTSQSNAPDGYVKVEDYNHPEPNEPMCLALTPSCGYCPGVLIEKECFIPESEIN